MIQMIAAFRPQWYPHRSIKPSYNDNNSIIKDTRQQLVPCGPQFVTMGTYSSRGIATRRRNTQRSVSELAAAYTTLPLSPPSPQDKKSSLISFVTPKDVGAISMGGSDPNRPQKVNQDSYFQSTLFIPSVVENQDFSVVTSNEDMMTTMTTVSNNNVTTAATTTTTLLDEPTSFNNSHGSNDDDKNNHSGKEKENTKKICWSLYGIAGVMDGHGRQAERLTKYLSYHLPHCIEQQLCHPKRMIQLESQIQQLVNFSMTENEKNVITTTRVVHDDDNQNDNDKIPQLLRNAFHQAQWDAMQNTDIPAGRCGTTCIVCLWDLQRQQSLYVANVGDSRAYRFRGRRSNDLTTNSMTHDKDTKKTTTTTTTMIWQVEALTTPTTVQESHIERQRIESCEGRIDGNGNVWYGPIGIAMTRALGDAAMLRAGVIPTPVVRVFSNNNTPNNNNNATQQQQECDERDWLVLATDGIWDVLSIQTIQDIVEQHAVGELSSTQDVAQLLSNKAQEAWLNQGPPMSIDEAKVDDITCVVVEL